MPPEFQVWNVMSTAGASILGVGYVLPLFYLLPSLWLRQAGGPEPLARDRTGMADAVAAADGELRDTPGRGPAAVRIPRGEGAK